MKQDVTFFTKTNLPIALAVMMDTSASMDTKLPIAQEAAIGFVRRAREQDLTEIIDFDSRVSILVPFTNNLTDLEQAIKKTSAGGSTSLYNAVYIALKDLKKLVATNVEEIRRRAIVVLSDGEDTSSLLPFDEVLDLAKRSETAIYAIASRKPNSPCGNCRRKRVAAHSSRIRWPTWRRCTDRFQKSCRASTPSATPPAIHVATAPGGALSSA
jgi:Ca-activated chloride channel family protein